CGASPTAFLHDAARVFETVRCAAHVSWPEVRDRVLILSNRPLVRYPSRDGRDGRSVQQQADKPMRFTVRPFSVARSQAFGQKKGESRPAAAGGTKASCHPSSETDPVVLDGLLDLFS